LLDRQYDVSVPSCFRIHDSTAAYSGLLQYTKCTCRYGFASTGPAGSTTAGNPLATRTTTSTPSYPSPCHRSETTSLSCFQPSEVGFDISSSLVQSLLHRISALRAHRLCTTLCWGLAAFGNQYHKYERLSNSLKLSSYFAPPSLTR